MVQLPALVVKQLAVPPGLKAPLTLALGTTALVFTSRTVTVTTACQFLPTFLALPTRLLMATVWLSTTPGAPLANEYTNLLGEPVPREEAAS